FASGVHLDLDTPTGHGFDPFGEGLCTARARLVVRRSGRPGGGHLPVEIFLRTRDEGKTRRSGCAAREKGTFKHATSIHITLHYRKGKSGIDRPRPKHLYRCSTADFTTAPLATTANSVPAFQGQTKNIPGALGAGLQAPRVTPRSDTSD